jgi:hypothetical protein
MMSFTQDHLLVLMMCLHGEHPSKLTCGATCASPSCGNRSGRGRGDETMEGQRPVRAKAHQVRITRRESRPGEAQPKSKMLQRRRGS